MRANGSNKLIKKFILLLTAVCGGLLMSVTHAFEVGGTVTGVTKVRSIECKNKTTDKKVRIRKNAGITWSCNAVGLSIIEGDLIRQKIDGRVSDPERVGGFVSGIGKITSVKCENKSKRKKVYISNVSNNQWSCSNAGLVAVSGDRVRQTVNGVSASSPAAPLSILVSIGDGELSLSWENVTGAEYYRIYSGFTPDFSLSADSLIGEVNAPAFVHSGLTNGTVYFYRLVSASSAGESAASTVVSGIPESTVFDHSTVSDQPCADCHEFPVSHIPTTSLCDACHAITHWLSVMVDHTQVIGSCASAGCHSMPGGHIATTNLCEACHISNAGLSWIVSPGQVDHNEIFGLCSGCHLKSAGHSLTTQICEACHQTSMWVTASVDHREVVGTCASAGCHVLPAGHITTSTNCEACHLATAGISWIVSPSAVNHSEVSGTCAVCHSLPFGHLNSTNACEICHETSEFPTWTPATVNHTEVLGSCTSCHNGQTAMGLPGGHCDTLGAECDNCHTTNNWTNALADCDVAQPPVAVPSPVTSPGPGPGPAAPGSGGMMGGMLGIGGNTSG